MQRKCPQRKQLRLKEYDYSSQGYYFITICTQNRKEILGEINNNLNCKNKPVGVALLGDPKKIKLTPIGMIVEKHIKIINKKFENIFINNYIIMPNHIHFIIEIKELRVAQECDPYNT